MSSKVISNLSVGLFGDVSHFVHEVGYKAPEAAKHFSESIGETGSKLLELTGIGAAIGAAFEGM